MLKISRGFWMDVLDGCVQVSFKCVSDRRVKVCRVGYGWLLQAGVLKCVTCVLRRYIKVHLI